MTKDLARNLHNDMTDTERFAWDKLRHRQLDDHKFRRQLCRRGFTLVEILVSMALTIFIMTIMAQAFIMGSDTFRTLKAVGDLNSSLRTATNTLRSDLSLDHFEGKRRLSEGRFYADGMPQQGYFFLYLPQTGANEGTDPDLIPSRRRVAHILAGTAKARGNKPQDFFSVIDPQAKLAAHGNPDARYQAAGTFSSQWIEFCYFMVPIPNGTAGGTQLYALYRQQRLVVADVDRLNWGNQQVSVASLGIYKDRISCQPNLTKPGVLYFNSPADLTIPERRTAGIFSGAATGVNPASFKPLVDATGQLTGEDLLLTDVLSFDIQVLVSTDLTKFVDLPTGAFDTWSQRTDDRYDYSAKANPFTIRPATILALQITLRVWDTKSKLTRQITMVQDM